MKYNEGQLNALGFEAIDAATAYAEATCGGCTFNCVAESGEVSCAEVPCGFPVFPCDIIWVKQG